jgi:hypothetical protein
LKSERFVGVNSSIDVRATRPLRVGQKRLVSIGQQSRLRDIPGDVGLIARTPRVDCIGQQHAYMRVQFHKLMRQETEHYE